MRKRGRIVLAAGVIAALGGLGWWGLAPRAPDPTDLVYDGHPLSYWVSRVPGAEVRFPIPSLDSNSLPYLIHALRRKDDDLDKNYQYLWSHLPGWLQNRAPFPVFAANVRYRACWILAFLGSKARLATPELVRLLGHDDDENVRMVAAYSLGEIADRDDKAAVEALVATATHAGDDYFRGIALIALKQIDPKAATKAGVK